MQVVVWEITIKLFVDDKDFVLVREPEQPVSTNLWACGGALAPGNETLGALDHNFHDCGLVPSVTLKRDLLDNVNDLF